MLGKELLAEKMPRQFVLRLDSPAKEGLIFEVVNGEETVENWNEVFSSLANSGNQE